MPQELYGVDDDSTTVYMYPQEIVGSNHRLVCVGTCHFPQGGCLGAVMLIDYENTNRARGPDPDEADYREGDERYAVKNITPQVFIERRTEPGWHFRQNDGTYVHDREGRYPRRRKTATCSGRTRARKVLSVAGVAHRAHPDG